VSIARLKNTITKGVNMKNDAYARATFLNTLKHQVRDITKALDAIGHVRFEPSLEATAVKREVTVLLSELERCDLLPDVLMIPDIYQRHALRTLYPDLTTNERLGLCGLGLSGEVGEVTDLLKKFLYHRNGKPLDSEKLKDELGDVLWNFFILLDTLDLTFEEVMMTNARKLETRHPNGFNPHYASDSHASEKEQL
jgi:NTP pyrophosphatase (non-canonical NTP hydrolase)